MTVTIDVDVYLLPTSELVHIKSINKHKYPNITALLRAKTIKTNAQAA